MSTAEAPPRLVNRRAALPLEGHSLLEVARLHDPLGVLSIYVDADPWRASGARPCWELRFRDELRALEQRLEWAGRHDRAKALRARLAELDDELVQLLHPSAPGRGRALFVPLSSGEPLRFALQLPLPDVVTLGDAVQLLPLLDAFEAGRPAGVVGVSRAGARVLDARLGVAEDVLWLEFEAATASWDEPWGRTVRNSAVRKSGARERDRRERRFEDCCSRFIRSAAGRVELLAEQRGWELMLLRGDAHLVERLRNDLLASNRQLDVETGAGSLEWRSAHEIGAAVAADLAGARRRRDWALVGQARDDARAGGLVALGLGDTLHALGEQRVLRLLLDGTPDHPGRREAHLAERMIGCALESGARVTPLAAEAAGALVPFDGVAALLRW